MVDMQPVVVAQCVVLRYRVWNGSCASEGTSNFLIWTLAKRKERQLMRRSKLSAGAREGARAMMSSEKAERKEGATASSLR
jgi:hypothetical protein